MDTDVKFPSFETQFKCVECNKTFERNSHLIRHLKTHVPARCEKCDATFSLAKRRHENSFHVGHESPSCKTACKTSNTAKRHRKINTSRKPRTSYPCSQCSKNYSNPVYLELHSKTHTDQAFECPENGCGKKFTTNSHLHSHTLRHSEKRPYPCPQCGSTFKENGDLQKHIRKKHTPDEVSRIHQCSFCSKRFKENFTLKKHETTHTHFSKRKSFACDQCPKKYSYKTTLVEHKKVHHFNYTTSSVRKRKPCQYSPSPCPMCKKVVMNLKQHFKFVHASKDFKCVFCPKTFTTYIYLENHLNIHLGQKPFACGDCGQEFHTLSQMGTHKKIHHNTRRMVYRCQFCQKTYLNNKTFKNHVDFVHKKRFKFYCSLCETGYQTMNSLQIHIRRIHTMEKPYKCDVCAYTTVSNASLRKHIYERHNPERSPSICYFCGVSVPFMSLHFTNHTMEVDFNCKLCPRRTRSLYSLKVHMYKTHG